MTIPVARLEFIRQTQIANNVTIQLTEDGIHTIDPYANRVVVKSILDDNTQLDITDILMGFRGNSTGGYSLPYYEAATGFFSVTKSATLWDTYHGYRDISNGGWGGYIHFDSSYAYWAWQSGFQAYPMVTGSYNKCSISDLTKNFEVIAQATSTGIYDQNWNSNIIGPGSHAFNYCVNSNTGALTEFTPGYQALANLAIPGGFLFKTGSTKPTYDANNGIICSYTSPQYNALDSNLIIQGSLPGIAYSLKAPGTGEFLIGLMPGQYPGVNANCQSLFAANANIYALFNGPNGFMDLYTIGNFEYVYGLYETNPVILHNYTLGAKVKNG